MMVKNNNLIFIAEIGLNHNGNFGLIYELIKQSAWSGAHCKIPAGMEV